MRILFLSRRFLPLRLGYVTENEFTARHWQNALQGLGNMFCSFRNAIAKNH